MSNNICLLLVGTFLVSILSAEDDRLCMSRGSDGKCSACYKSYFNTEKGKCVVSTKIIDFVRSYAADGIAN
jgi:hypothetical protein